MKNITLKNQYYTYSMTVTDDKQLHHGWFLPAGYDRAPQPRECRRIYPYEVTLATADGKGLGWRFADTCFRHQANHELEFVGMEQQGELTVLTLVNRALSVQVELFYLCRKDSPALQRWTRVTNVGTAPTDLYHVSSFVLGGFPYFGKGSDMYLHSYTSGWSIEGDERVDKLSDLGILAPGCRSAWSINNNSAYSTHRNFPYFVMEEKSADLCWGVQIESAAQWRVELGGGDVINPDWLYLQGGLPNFWGGQWLYTLQPGESMETPKASLTVATGGAENVYNRMHTHQMRCLIRQPEADRALPVIFNDWQVMKGDTSETRIGAQLDALEKLGVEIYVTDAGWYTEQGENVFTAVGHWKSNDIRFPNGLSAASRNIRQHGMIPGIWCEIEFVGPKSPCYEKADMLLKWRGRIIEQDSRRFLDFRKEEVRDFAAGVFRMLYENGFRYIKIDYNNDCGPGCDGPAESPAENLRQARLHYLSWLDGMLNTYPDLIIESCASGGLKLDYENLSRGSLASITDQWDFRRTGAILRNTTRLLHPIQCENWSTLKADMDSRTMAFTLTNSMMGRMCISCEVAKFEPEQQELIRTAVAFYRRHRHLLRACDIYYHGADGKIMDDGKLNVMEYVAHDGQSALLWLSGASWQGEFTLTPKLGEFEIADCFPCREGVSVRDGVLEVSNRSEGPFGRVLLLTKK